MGIMSLGKGLVVSRRYKTLIYLFLPVMSAALPYSDMATEIILIVSMFLQDLS